MLTERWLGQTWSCTNFVSVSASLQGCTQTIQRDAYPMLQMDESVTADLKKGCWQNLSLVNSYFATLLLKRIKLYLWMWGTTATTVYFFSDISHQPPEIMQTHRLLISSLLAGSWQPSPAAPTCTGEESKQYTWKPSLWYATGFCMIQNLIKNLHPRGP